VSAARPALVLSVDSGLFMVVTHLHCVNSLNHALQHIRKL
jgi:hypothetical protein